jgi:hypothetical protein
MADDVAWVRIRSWHIFRTYTRAGGGVTVCGRRVGSMAEPPDVRDERPEGKTCETCYRIAGPH